MKMKRKHVKIGFSAGLAAGWFSSVIITVICATVVTHMILSEMIEEGSLNVMVGIILSIASIVGAVVSSSLLKEKYLPVCMGTGACYLLTLLAMTALVFEGQYQSVGIGTVIILLSCGLTAIIQTKLRKKTTWKKRPYR